MPFKVGFLGPEGTYTHQALIQQFGNDRSQVEIVALKTIGDCFEALESKKVDYTVVPFENSTNGQVVYTYDLLRDWFLPESDAGSHVPKFSIVAEQFVAIHHNFITRASDIDSITTIYSHPQVWTQVSSFLQSLKLAPSVKQIDTSSTSKAAQLVNEDATNTTACISSEASSELYGLPIMYRSIEDNHNNTTRFLVLGSQPLPYRAPESAPAKAYITSVMFTLNHNDPGALCDVLNVFREYGVNLTSINSRPSHLKKWQYLFFVEILAQPDESKQVKSGLEKAEQLCLNFVELGTFERSWRYNSN
ncbi:Prephenate dehydratase [Suhomyces tanzawaensis NRRL Y-17324]|uniref:prephenate dehydratase n=1 Tax=Suhomyces tanzawaensis NRRL Y-17324 TaxID=984487 RepID=A0A1E4SC44_9ASCO|nr:Prephenate dehydratase [Suhomyces tanzawaensis NRRL Y-17324]ODV77036.1 Prephenate dehydratase [Suhomyces tanzawaensis NRRL Y-17324]